ncbi:MAG: hypothetical protein F4X56_00840 [Gammaproteobacteria bacterium]|nr:hypothetical protein [Gammaproteobacteria bacterium]
MRTFGFRKFNHNRLLVLPLVLLSLGVIADERIIFGSFERESAKEGFNTLGVDIEVTETLNGFGVRSFKFNDKGFYHGDGFTFLTGDRQACLPGICNSFDARKVVASFEVGKDIGQWIPFVGLSIAVSHVEFEINTDRKYDLTKGLIAGSWYKLDTFILRGAVSHLDDGDNRTISGGLLYQMDNRFALGAELGWLLDSDVDRLSFSLQFGRSF